MARGLTRMRRATFSQSIKAAETTSFATHASEVLQPTQKSVQAIRSRAVLVRQWLAQAQGGIKYVSQRTGGVSRASVTKVTQGIAPAARSLIQGLRSRLPRRSPIEAQEPDLEALFALPPTETEVAVAPPAIKTRVVETPVEPKATPTLTLTTFHRAHAPAKKKLSALQRALQALQEKNYQHAEDILVDHIVHHTKDTKAYMLLGRVASARADWQEAMEIYEQVVRWHPEEPGAQAGLGIAAYNCGRYSKALQALQRAHEEDPTNLVVLNDLLGIAQKMDNPALQRSIQTKLREAGAAQSAHPVGR